jgi:hypothetical protein
MAARVTPNAVPPWACTPSPRPAALLAQLDLVPDLADAHDPLQWDGAGLPK